MSAIPMAIEAIARARSLPPPFEHMLLRYCRHPNALALRHTLSFVTPFRACLAVAVESLRNAHIDSAWWSTRKYLAHTRSAMRKKRLARLAHAFARMKVARSNPISPNPEECAEAPA